MSYFIMQHYYFSFVLILFSVSFALDNFDDYGFFGLDDLNEPLSDVSGSTSSAFDAGDVPPNEDVFNQNDDMNLDMFSQVNEDETNTDLLAAGCPTTDRLGARDGTKCSNTHEQIQVPELPTLDMSEKMTPSIPQDEGLVRSEDTAITGTENNGVCPPLKPIHLCCLCEAQFQFYYCQDCLPSKPATFTFSSMSALKNVNRLLKDLRIFGSSETKGLEEENLIVPLIGPQKNC